MLGGQPLTDMVSSKQTRTARLWIRRVLVRSQEGQLRGTMNRRDFLSSTAAVSAALAFPLGQRKWRPLGRSTSAAGDWRSFEVTTRVEVLKPAGTTRIWVPAALVSETP